MSPSSLHPLQASTDWNLSAVVRALRNSREDTHRVRHLGRLRELPSREALAGILQGLSAVLFPTHYGRPDLTDESIDFFVGNTLSDTLTALSDQVRRALMFAVPAAPHSGAQDGDDDLRQKAQHVESRAKLSQASRPKLSH